MFFFLLVFALVLCYNGRMNKVVDLTPLKQLVYTEKREIFGRFFALLSEYNSRFNLTAITGEEEVFEKHFLDSVAGESLFPKGARVLEVGSGAGFPSLPLKIVREDLYFTLVESTGKKCEFLKTTVRELGLTNVEILNVRAEELARNPAYRDRFDVCCARAVARLNTLSEYCMPFVKTGGVFIAYKANADEEIQEARTAFKKLGGEECGVFRYELPNGSRTLIEVKKLTKTPAAYPRGQGKERKNPL